MFFWVQKVVCGIFLWIIGYSENLRWNLLSEKAKKTRSCRSSQKQNLFFIPGIICQVGYNVVKQFWRFDRQEILLSKLLGSCCFVWKQKFNTHVYSKSFKDFWVFAKNSIKYKARLLKIMFLQVLDIIITNRWFKKWSKICSRNLFGQKLKKYWNKARKAFDGPN